MSEVFTTTISSKILNSSFELGFHLGYKVSEHIKCPVVMW